MDVKWQEAKYIAAMVVPVQVGNIIEFKIKHNEIKLKTLSEFLYI